MSRGGTIYGKKKSGTQEEWVGCVYTIILSSMNCNIDFFEHSLTISFHVFFIKVNWWFWKSHHLQYVPIGCTFSCSQTELHFSRFFCSVCTCTQSEIFQCVFSTMQLCASSTWRPINTYLSSQISFPVCYKGRSKFSPQMHMAVPIFSTY